MKDKSEIQTVWFRHEEKTQPFCLHVHKILNMVLIIPHTLTSNKRSMLMKWALQVPSALALLAIGILMSETTF